MKTKLIAASKRYDVCELVDGALVITSKRAQRGVKILRKLAPGWRECLTQALDERELDALCSQALRS